ncbi:hypothetical protein ZIOFF_067942 [Zingiber officinale]|uniref:Deoxyuridine 5'-triphosphate nucleotidohydrolase n=1 Tax=Zingiber officinale TaxID=94328 RepID=A0A8J5EEC7_ZINOF|nr:hypothetical protein ZIOFF_067942 [Zingiber officinale]
MVGRLSNTPNVSFAYEIQGVVDYLANHGVNALPGRRDCTLEDEEERELIAVLTTTKIGYEEDYITSTEKHSAINVNIDYEEDPNQIIASSKEFPFILVHRLLSTSTMLQLKSLGAVGLDLAVDKTVIIEPRGRALVSTGLSLEIPWGTYGRITTHSSAAWNLGLDICVGVIDSDYIGEIIIMVFNHSDVRVIIAEGTAIAHIIFEKIIHPNVYEVPQLSATVRGSGGFGSTNNKASSSNPEPHTTRYKPNWDILLPKEKQIISAFAEEETLIWHL